MKCLIVSGGTPPAKSDLLKYMKDAALIIAADGAADVFIRCDVLPHVIIGDMDSAKPHSIAYLSEQGAKTIHLQVAKNETDTQAALDYALWAGADDIVLLGATGTRIDHTLANISMLLRAAQAGVKCRIIDRYNEIQAATMDFDIHGRKGQTISILPLTSDICVSATNLVYPLNELTLCRDASRGISNIIQKSPARIRISGGWALIVKIRRKA